MESGDQGASKWDSARGSWFVASSEQDIAYHIHLISALRWKYRRAEGIVNGSSTAVQSWSQCQIRYGACSLLFSPPAVTPQEHPIKNIARRFED